jgi:ABC-type bacteriocin/lantibiotic exporter with double-glycine peptidase domain
MPATQAIALTELVARRLQVPLPSGRLDPAARRTTADLRTLAAFTDHVNELARGLDLTYLRRSVRGDDLARLLRADALPLVVLAGPDAHGTIDATLFTARDGRELIGTRVRPGGATEPVRCTADDAAARLGLGADAAGALLSPVRLATGATPGEEPTPVQRLWRLLREERRDIGLVYVYATLMGLLSLTLPLGVQSIIGLVSGGLILQPVAILIGAVVLGTMASGVLQLLQMSVVEMIEQRVFARLALEFSFRVPRVRLEDVRGVSLPELMNRFFEAVNIQKNLAKLLTDASTALLQVLFGLILLSFYHPYFTFFGAVIVGVVVLILWATGPKGLRTNLKESTYKYRAVHWLEEVARAITAFKFAGRSSLPVARMDEELTGYLTYRREHFKVLIQQSAAFLAFKVVITGGLLVLGSVLVIDRQITLGQFVASEIVIVTVLAGVEKIVASLKNVYDVLTAVEKAGHVTDLPLEPVGGLVLPASTAGMAITARDLAYTYPDATAPTLAGIALDISPGEKVAVTGYFGSGQTTLLRVLGGLFESYRGAISYDGLNLRELDRAALRDVVGQYLSEDDLFDGTGEENVAVGRAAVDTAEVMRVLRLVGLGDWVAALPQGLSTPITAGGEALASTVRIKLLLAQALAGRPRLVLFDDFVGELEAESREQVLRVLTGPDAPWTLIAASHDPVFLRDCHRVIVLRDGHVVADGPYGEVCEDPHFRDVVGTAATPAARG